MFGTFSGVFVPSFEAILGAVLFLILPMLTAELGLYKMLIIVVLANTATLATAFSISDCATNLKRVGPGGMYALSKSSFGRAFGGSIGIQLFLAQAASIGFYAIGFAGPIKETIVSIPFVSEIVINYGLSDLVIKQIIATVVALIAFLSALIGADFIVKIQFFIFLILNVSVASILVSPLASPLNNGFAVFNSIPNIAGNTYSLSFWAAFAMFFPAVTGIDAGVGMSGNLKDPKKSLVRGTFFAIFITALVYVAVTYVYSFINPVFMQSETGVIPSVLDVFSDSLFIRVSLFSGIIFATGSSALSYFMTAPRTAQALAQDDILPGFFKFLGKDFIKGGKEPRFASLFSLLIVLPVIWAGDVDLASLIVGICFLVVYAWINLAAFLERVSGNPSFRPSSKGHWSLSLYGFLVCMIVIGLFNFYLGLAVIISQIIIFSLILKYKSNNKLEGVWWGVLFSLISWGTQRIKRIIQGTKNWRPIVGVFCLADKKEESDDSIRFASRFVSYKGLVMVNILKSKKTEDSDVVLGDNEQIVLLNDNDYENAISSIVQSTMPGGLQLNTAFLTFDERLHFVGLIEKLVSLGKNVLLYQPGKKNDSGVIDLWWKAEGNGNFMALLAFIIKGSYSASVSRKMKIRIIRKLMEGEDEKSTEAELAELLSLSRLEGEVLVLPAIKEDISMTISRISRKSELIMMGMPGDKSKALSKVFNLDKVFFEKELKKFQDLPPVLFVKAANVIKLAE